jgi:hypothetical protein
VTPVAVEKAPPSRSPSLDGDGGVPTVLLDSTLYGRLVIREPLVTRIGYAGADFTSNLIRFVGEERLTQTIERPQAICEITGLPGDDRRKRDAQQGDGEEVETPRLDGVL